MAALARAGGPAPPVRSQVGADDAVGSPTADSGAAAAPSQNRARAISRQAAARVGLELG